MQLDCVNIIIILTGRIFVISRMEIWENIMNKEFLQPPMNGL